MRLRPSSVSFPLRHAEICELCTNKFAPLLGPVNPSARCPTLSALLLLFCLPACSGDGPRSDSTDQRSEDDADVGAGGGNDGDIGAGGADSAAGSPPDAGGATVEGGAGGANSNGEYTGDYMGMLKQCVAVCENYNTQCADDLNCSGYCEEWQADQPRACDALKEIYFGCLATQPSACTISDWGNGLDDVCDPVPETTCRLAGGKDCGRDDRFQISCSDSYAYFCQEGKAPSICEEEDPLVYPGLYCCTSPDL